MKKNTLLLLCCFCFHHLVAQDISMLRQKGLTLKRFMEKKHYQPLSWNNESSERLFNRWMTILDEEKLFFTQADIASLEKYRHSLDEELNGGAWLFFKESSTLYRKRLVRVDSMLKTILSKPLDFPATENLEFPIKTYAANDATLQTLWKKYCKWQVMRKVAEENDSIVLSPSAYLAAEKKAIAAQKTEEENYLKHLIGESPADFFSELQDSYLESIAWCYDPHSTYMNLSVKDEFETRVSASEYSVGFDVEENEKGEPVISFLEPGGSAWRNGQLHKGDVLMAIKIGNQFKNIEDLSEQDFEESFGGANSKDTEIKVRTATGEIKTVKLSKQKIANEEEVVKSYVLPGPANIGYINLPGFYSRENQDVEKMAQLKFDGSANDLSKEIVKLKKDTIAGLILDLRYNGGGSIWEAMQLAGIFIDIGPVATIKDREGKIQILKDPNRGTIYDGPLLVLINGASASASEFVSAVLQDYNRAIIVGGTTYGKGTAQSVLPLDTGLLQPNKKYEDFVKVTEEKFYRVNGATTQWKGVSPDIVLPDLYSGDEHKEKSEISALLPDENKPAIFRPGAALPIQQLKEKSAHRVAGNSFFKAVNQYLNLRKVYDKGRIVPMNWPAYLVKYREAQDLYKQADEKQTGMAVAIPVRNNSFDKDLIRLADEDSREGNNFYLKRLGDDPVLAEARAIVLDWVQKN
jgi:carboxyl-terminal processing protease